ncbi:rho GTPase-activating protein 22-like, partial [Gracilinanus agilis]|uniref:rho GTPase-activating protein 22-like n=1 Tax=Gracilinanus agilis TaxID=191870 RepID=UPI001CFD1F99
RLPFHWGNGLAALPASRWPPLTPTLSLCFLTGTSLVQHLMTILISKHNQLFSAAYSDVPAPEPEIKSPAPRSAAEWILEEHVEEGWKESNPLGLSDGPSKRTGSLDSATVGTLPKPSQERISRRAQTCPNKTSTSPSKKVQTLPNWKYSFRQPGTKSGSPKLVSSSLDINSLPTSGNWLMNGLSSLRGHRRTSSGDRTKDSSLPQRLSTYDNVPSGSPSTSAQSVASMAWSTSSCEISVVDSVSNCPVCHASGSSPCNSVHFEWPTKGSPGMCSDVKSAEMETSNEGLAACVSTLNGSSSEGNNFNSMSRDSAQCSHALQSLVTELKAELSKQRTEYESSLK